MHRTIWIQPELDKTIEETRKKLGWKRSYFYKYCLTKILQELSVLTTQAHSKLEDIEKGEKGGE